jgi:hypothetical protein
MPVTLNSVGLRRGLIGYVPIEVAMTKDCHSRSTTTIFVKGLSFMAASFG